MISRHVLSRTVCYAELSMPGKNRSTPTDRDRAVLERLLRAESMKCIAIDLGCSMSSVSVIVSKTLRQLGFVAPYARSPMFLALLAHVASTSDTRHRLLGLRLEGAPAKRGIACIRPDLWLRQLLTPAEADVVEQLLRGDSYTSIAASRTTSTRTVANQISHVYSKLRVSGRLELLVRTIRNVDRGGQLPLPTPKETQHAA
jgi:DNA-binding NarL/FixJ family response regulator